MAEAAALPLGFLDEALAEAAARPLCGFLDEAMAACVKRGLLGGCSSSGRGARPGLNPGLVHPLASDDVTSLRLRWEQR